MFAKTAPWIKYIDVSFRYIVIVSNYVQSKKALRLERQYTNQQRTCHGRCVSIPGRAQAVLSIMSTRPETARKIPRTRAFPGSQRNMRFPGWMHCFAVGGRCRGRPKSSFPTHSSKSFFGGGEGGMTEGRTGEGRGVEDWCPNNSKKQQNQRVT